MKILKKAIISLSLFTATWAAAHAAVKSVEWDAQSIIIDGKRVAPVMGEVHYSRIPEAEWPSLIKKMKEGGITMIATYVFWNHHESEEGKFDWTGNRNLRKFVEACAEQDMPVVLRLGPFCHGEVRNGGIPDYIFTKGCKVRDINPTFTAATKRLYQEIFDQVKGLQWKDGGPIMAAQFDNEYRGSGAYLMALKDMAKEIGFDLPFYTLTGWPELSSPVPFGEMIPLYGAYADGFWERSLKEGAGKYYEGFNFADQRSSSAIANEQLSADELKVKNDNAYPYFTCELGGGMTVAYHRRPYIYPEDAYSLAIVKLGSGSNLLGYYMYAGGTNPSHPDYYMNEQQDTPATNYNDMPHYSYEFQAPIGEFGQLHPHFYTLRKLHMFLQDYGDILAPMTTQFMTKQQLKQGEDSTLRYSYRTDGNSAFVFVNNYERLRPLSDKKDVSFTVGDLTFPSKPITIPSGTACIFPVGIDGIDYATAQIVAKRDGNIYLQQIPGVSTEISVGGKVISDVQPYGFTKPVVDNIYLLTEDDANMLFVPSEYSPADTIGHIQAVKKREALGSRNILIGGKGVAVQPSDSDFDNAAAYNIPLPDNRDCLLDINYRGDCARLYADGKFIEDNFYNGRPFQFGLWRLPEGTTDLELRILPIQADMPVYFPKEADTRPGEALNSINIISKK